MHNNSLLNSLILLLLTFSFCSCSSDTISIHKPLRDGELLVSKSKTFALGFFTPGKSTSRYVGIWYYNLPIQTVVWVANRNSPINNTSGILSIDPNGNLVLHHNLSTIPIWSTDVSFPQSQRNSTSAVIAQLSDIANLVLMINNTKTVLWESFDHPTDTLLPYLRLGFDKKTNQSWFLQSWKTDDDPGNGAFTVKFSTIGKPQVLMYNHDLPWWRGGHWNGANLIGAPDMKRDMAILNVSFLEDDDNYVAFSYNMFAKSVITRVVIQQSGFLQTFRWDSQTGQWSRCWSEPSDECGNYGTCGSNGNCDPFNFDDFKCSCLLGYEPKFPRDWYQNRDGTGGCVRKKGSSVCENGEGFIKVVSLKVPDTSVAVAKSGLSLEECEKECLQNCSCTAYSIADVRNGGSGCLAWHGDLIDIQKLNDQGQDLFLRVDKIELANYYRKRKGVFDKKRLTAILVASIIAIVLLLSCVNYMWKKKREGLRAVEVVKDLEPLKIQGLILRQPFFGGKERAKSELKLENDQILPLCVTDLMWELALPIGADRDHEYCNPRVGNSFEKFDKIRDLEWKVLVSGNGGDPVVDREKELAQLMEEKGVHVVKDFDEDGCHGIEYYDPLKAKKLIELIKGFIS